MLQNATPQVIQTTDGQTLIYQQVQMQDGTQALVQQPAQSLQGGQVIQLASSLGQQPQAHLTTQTMTTSTASANGGQAANQNIIMMVPGATGGTSPSMQRIPLPGLL